MLRVTYFPAYAKGTRRNKRPEPRAQSFSEPIGPRTVKVVRQWVQEQIDADPVAQAFTQEEADEKRRREETQMAQAIEGAGAMPERSGKQPPRRARRAPKSTAGGRPFKGFGKAAVIDVETTGLSPETERIVEVAVARGDFSVVLRGETQPYFETFEARVNPGRSIPAKASKVHGIHDQDVADADRFEAIAEQLRDFIGNRPLIGHNIAFDLEFLNAEFERAGVEDLSRNPIYCTMQRFRQVFPGEPSTLDAVAARTGRKRMGTFHGALEDAMLTVAIAANFYLADNGRAAPAPEAAKDPDAPETTSGWWGWALAAALAAGILLIVSQAV